MAPIKLFAHPSLHSWLVEERLPAVMAALRNLADERLAESTTDDLIAQLSEMFRLEPVVLDRAGITRIRSEMRQDMYPPRLKTQFRVPFTGPVTIFSKTTRMTRRQVEAERVDTTALELAVYADIDVPNHTESLLDRELNEIQSPYLDSANEQIDEYNREMDRIIRREIPKIRESAIRALEIVSRLPFPLHRDHARESEAFPVVRNELRPTRQPSASPFVRSPFLDDADYEAVLSVLHSMRLMIERSPTTFSKLATQEEGSQDKVEERFRDLFLVMLNTVFTGQVSGEVFNNLGKTDILVRVDDGNIFIGECKFYSGPKSVSDALDQLLRQQSWRDTKAALLLFIRDREDASAATEKAREAMLQHPQFASRGVHSSDLRFDVAMRSTIDGQQLIKVALLPFVFPYIKGQRLLSEIQDENSR